MELKTIDHKLTVCKVTEVSNINMDTDFYFIGKTDEELSLVCKTEDTPQNTIERDDGWNGLFPAALVRIPFSDWRTGLSKKGRYKCSDPGYSIIH